MSTERTAPPADDRAAAAALRKRARLTRGLFWSATMLAAIVVPLAGHLYLDHQINRTIEQPLSAALGTDVSIDSAEVGLTGELTLRGIAVGDLLAADSVNAAAGLSTILSGKLSPDELIVTEPKLRVHATDSGNNLTDLLSRARALRKRRATPSASRGDRKADRTSGIRRIIVSGGDLRVDLGDHGHARISDVSLHRQPDGGFRLLTGPVSADVRAGSLEASGEFTRAAADVGPDHRLSRVVAVGGELDANAGGPRLPLANAGVLYAGHDHSVRITADAGRGRVRVEAALVRSRDGGLLPIEITGHDVPLNALDPLMPDGVDVSHAVASGQLRATSEQALHIAASVRDLRLDHRRVSVESFSLSGSIAAVATVSGPPGARAVRVQDASIAVGDVKVRASANLRTAGGQLDFAGVAVSLPRTPCAELLAAIPEPLRRDLAGLDLAGQFGGSVSVVADFEQPERSRIKTDLTNKCRANAEAVAANPKMLRGKYHHTTPGGHTLGLYRGAPGYQPADVLPAYVLRVWLASEDGRFLRHEGFDPRQIERSLVVNVRKRRLVRGGSTITQQLAKNLFLTRRRTLARKLSEAVLTWRLEATLNKRELLERYANLIELGEKVFGIDAAARHWFGKSAADLSPREAAFFAAITPAPVMWSRRTRELGAVPPQLVKKVDRIVREMKNIGLITTDEYRRAKRQRLRLAPTVAMTR